mgnify:CR=1 FL=1
MKKYILAVAALFISTPSWAVHQLIFRDASALTTGTVSNDRLDHSSVTFLGPTIETTEITGLFASSNILPGSTFMSVFDEATPQGNINSLNVTGSIGAISVVGGTGTLALNAAGFLTSIPKTYNVTVCTLGVTGCDIASNTLDGVDAALGLLGARGLSIPPANFYGSTVQGKILFIGGPFDIAGATCPYGITFAMIKGSSSSWMPLDGTYGSSRTILANWGTIKDLTIDGGSQPAFGGYKVIAGSGAVFNGLRLQNFTSVTRVDQIGKNLLGIVNVSTVTFNDLELDNCVGRIEGGSHFGDGATVLIDNSTNVYFNRTTFGKFVGQQGNFTAFGLSRSVNVRFYNLFARQAFGDFININGGVIDWEISDSEFHISGIYNNGRGIVGGTAQQFGSASSTGAIINCRFFHEPGGSNQAIVSLNSGSAHGVFASGNQFFNRSGGTPTGINVSANTNDTLLLYNRYYGMGSGADAGANTRRIE